MLMLPAPADGALHLQDCMGPFQHWKLPSASNTTRPHCVAKTGQIEWHAMSPHSKDIGMPFDYCLTGCICVDGHQQSRNHTGRMQRCGVVKRTGIACPEFPAPRTHLPSYMWWAPHCSLTRQELLICILPCEQLPAGYGCYVGSGVR
jgi:hypothetical protein